MMQVFPPRTTALAKKELLYCGPFGVAAWLAGMIFVDRSNRKKAHEIMANTASVMHARNVNVWIFPEGTRNCGEKLLPFKKGAFHLAIQAQVPIFPIVLSSYRDFLSRDKRIFNTGRVIVSCLPRFNTAGLSVDAIDELVEKVHNSMESVFLSTSAEVHEDALRTGRSILLRDCSPVATGNGDNVVQATSCRMPLASMSSEETMNSSSKSFHDGKVTVSGGGNNVNKRRPSKDLTATTLASSCVSDKPIDSS
jgi:1-acyl-sn-glycerol-3-phosphate acyltransferase